MSNKSIESVFRGTIVIVFVSALAKLVSFFTEAILAAFLGTTYQSDAYYMVSSIQGVIYPMMSIGIWKVFLPLYKSHIAKGENNLAQKLTDISLTFFTTISFVVMVVLILFAPTVVSVVAPGFEGETRSLCIRLVRVSSPMYVFIIASAVYASMLQCHNKFFASQIREVVSHIPTIIAACIFYKMFGIEAMAIALVLASLCRLLIELPFVNWGYRFRVNFRFKSKEFSQMLLRLPSALISAGVAQINTLVDKAMASTLPSGTISGLNYGQKLMNVFSGLLSTAISTAMYPQMIELISLGKKDSLGKLVIRIINVFCILMFPITIACVLFRQELVAAVFQRGAFNADSTNLTANVFCLYCLGLFFIACNDVLSNIFYGFGDTKTPMQISLVNLAINVGLNIIFINMWGVNGLALATSVSAILTFFIRLLMSERHVKLEKRLMLTTTLKVLFASVVACMLPRTLFWVYPLNKYLVLLLSAVIGIVVYFLCLKALKVSELNQLMSILLSRIKGNKSV